MKASIERDIPIKIISNRFIVNNIINYQDYSHLQRIVDMLSYRVIEVLMKYFKEIEDKYIDRVYSTYPINREYTLTGNLNDFSIKYRSVFTRINELSRDFFLVKIRENYRKLGELNEEDYDKRIKIESDNSCYIKKLLYTYSDSSYDRELDLTHFFDMHKTYSGRLSIIDCDYDSVMKSLQYYCNLLELINMTKDNLLNDIHHAINDLDKLRVTIYDNNYGTVSLPDYWYILPSCEKTGDVLFNTTGENGHKDTNLKYLLTGIFYENWKFSKGYALEYFNEVKELQKKDFMDYRTYMDTVKFGMGYSYPIIIYDNDGLPYGAREKYIEMQNTLIKSELEQSLTGAVTKDKRKEFYELLEEKSKYFFLLDHNNLPMGVYEIIQAIFDNATDETLGINNSKRAYEVFTKFSKNFKIAKMTPDSFANMQLYGTLLQIENSVRSINEMNINEISPIYIYNSMAKDLVIGVKMAHGLVIKFMADLYKKVDNYDECINYLRTMDRDDFFFFFCGFNKVVRQMKNGVCYREIITSNLNYEEEFKEYIQYGWNIKFIPPIRIDEYSKSLREMDDFCKVKRFHVKD